jgi:m7GpppX diphosphatase
MLHIVNREENKKYTFIPNSKWIDDIDTTNNELIFKNDVYEKTRTTIKNLSGELIVCSDLSKLDEFCKKIIKETYEEYLEIISKRDFKKEKWIYNILDGIAEQEKILYKDNLMVLIPNYTWNENDILQMHLLALPIDKSLHTLRDLTELHINLLNHIKEKSLETIKIMYGFDEDIIKMYIHYVPTTYHLHIHFVLISNTSTNSSVEYSHNLNMVIEILKIKSDYYKTTILDKRI